jgi:hypothetical protein
VDFRTTNNAKIPIIRPALAVCRVKNRLADDFRDFMREAQQTARGLTSFFCNYDFSRSHVVPHFRSNTLTGSRTGLGGGDIFSLREYPVWKVVSVYTATAGTVQGGEPLFSPVNFVDPKHYYCLPDESIREDLPFPLVLRSPYRLVKGEHIIFIPKVDVK